GLPPTLAKLSAGGLTWYSAFICARVPFLFLFAQLEENDDRLYFRVIDGLQSVLIIGLITLVFSPGTLGAAPMRPGQTLILLSLVFPLLAFFGWRNPSPTRSRTRSRTRHPLLSALGPYCRKRAMRPLWR